MSWKIHNHLLILAFTVLPSGLHADVHPFESKKTDQLTVTTPDKTVSLTVSLERINREKIREVQKGENEEPEAWLGDRRIPSGVLWHRATLISSFSLTIDGKKISIPARFWNDLPGLDLEKVIINKKIKTENDRWKLQEFTQQCERPHVVRSADGGTVLISWIRPEE